MDQRPVEECPGGDRLVGDGVLVRSSRHLRPVLFELSCVRHHIRAETRSLEEGGEPFVELVVACSEHTPIGQRHVHGGVARVTERIRMIGRAALKQARSPATPRSVTSTAFNSSPIIDLTGYRQMATTVPIASGCAVSMVVLQKRANPACTVRGVASWCPIVSANQIDHRQL